MNHTIMPFMPARGVAGALFFVVFVGCSASDGPETAAFRVRTDVGAPLNADAGWGGGLNERAIVQADQPFRVRMEVATTGASGALEGAAAVRGVLRLQVRRNEGQWVTLEAHDFPYPQRRLSLSFDEDRAGAQPAGWTVVQGDPASLSVVPARGQEGREGQAAAGVAGAGAGAVAGTGSEAGAGAVAGTGSAAGAGAVAGAGGPQVLQVRAGAQPTIALHSSPWELDDFALSGSVQFRAVGEFTGEPQGAGGRAGLVFGYQDAQNYGLLLVEPEADGRRGAVRLSHFSAGIERILAEREITIPLGTWLELEIQGEGDELEVKLDALRFTVPKNPDLRAEGLGFFVGAGSEVWFRRFLLEGEPRTPGVSIVGVDGYAAALPTSDLLLGSPLPFEAGVGVNLAAFVPVRGATTRSASFHTEIEWPLVIRRLSDGVVTFEDGDVFEFRVVDSQGQPLLGSAHPSVTLRVPAGHLGGTYVETPGRIGPWQASNGDLYFIMEPTETDNRFLMMKSEDEGVSWREVDGENRPSTGDLEAVDSRLVDGTLHILHQVTRSARYHTFHTSDHPTHPDQWGITDEVAATATAVAQLASLEVGADGRVVAFYTGETLRYAVRSPSGAWSPERVLDPELGVNTTGPQSVLGSDGTIHLAYYGMDGTIWYRRMGIEGTLSPRVQLATGAGATRSEFGAVLPLVYIARTQTVVVVYRLDDGRLWERRITNGAPPSPAVRISERSVITNAVDSQQPAADVALDGDVVHVLFVDAASRSIYHTHDRGGWQPATAQVEGILGSWVRGQIYTRRDGVRVYGYVFDAGSFGGAGMNRFREVVLGGR